MACWTLVFGHSLVILVWSLGIDMSHMYFILSVAGWIWTGVVAVFLIVSLKKQKQQNEEHS